MKDDKLLPCNCGLSVEMSDADVEDLVEICEKIVIDSFFISDKSQWILNVDVEPYDISQALVNYILQKSRPNKKIKNIIKTINDELEYFNTMLDHPPTVSCQTYYEGKKCAMELIKSKLTKGYGAWDDDGVIRVQIEPEIENITLTSQKTIKGRFGDQFEVDVIGSSKVGARLISNIDALPKAPPGYSPPEWDTMDTKEIALSQRQANQYNNCKGICYATTASRAQQAYIDAHGQTIINLDVSNSNIDHRIASTQGGTDPFMGYGAGGPFARRGYGECVDDSGVWGGLLKRGALLQNWHSTAENDLFSGGGHSVIFRNYLYNENGVIRAIAITDYKGGVNVWNLSDYLEETILGVNLLDEKK